MALGEPQSEGVPPAPLALDVASLAGSFPSLAVDLWPAALAGLRRRHILQAGTCIEAPGAEGVFLRLNLRHGPNTDRITQTAEFEFCHTDFDEVRVTAAWMDFIVLRPVPERIVIADLIVSRNPRAEV